MVHSGDEYEQKGTSLTSDVILDEGTDLVLFEATAKRLTIPSTLDADKQKIEDDLNAMIRRQGRAARPRDARHRLRRR